MSHIKNKSIVILSGFLLSAVLFATSCGMPGALNTSLYKGGEVSSIVSESILTGLVVCNARQGTVGNLPLPQLLEVEVNNYFNIDSGRGYKKSDVDSCAQNIMMSVSLDPYCSYLGWKALCTLNPVNKITGAN